MRQLLTHTLLLSGIICAAGSVAAAQEATPLSLEQCINYAVKNNVAAKNARLDVQIQESQNAQTLAAAYPHVNGRGEFNDFIKPPVTFFPNDAINLISGKNNLPPGEFQTVTFTPRYSSAATLSASQLLFDGSLLVALQARNTIMELARQNGKLTEESIRYNVQRAYYALVIAQKQFGIISNTLGTARDIAKDIAILRQAGFAEKIEVDRTNVQVNNLATDSLRISNLLTVSEQALKYGMGMDIHQSITLTDTSIESNLAQAPAMAEEDIDYENRTEYRLLQTQLKLNQYNLKRYRLAALPSLNVFGNAGYNYSADNFSDLFIRRNYIFSSLVGLQLNVPILNGWQRVNQVKEARFNIEKNLNSIDNIRLTIDFQTETARATLRNNLLLLQSQQRNLDLANSVLDLARKKYKAGVGSNLEVSQAQTELLQAQNNYFQSQLEVVNAQADLQRALGQFK